jgi:hypothetical protein
MEASNNTELRIFNVRMIISPSLFTNGERSIHAEFHVSIT